MFADVDTWILVRTQPRREKWAAKNVERQGAEAFLPLCLQPRKRTPTVMFPSYLFVKIVRHWWFLKGTFGVRSILMDGELPRKVPLCEIERLQEQSDQNGVIKLEEREPFDVGQALQVNHGPFRDHTVYYAGMCGLTRVKVLLTLLGAQREVELRFADVSAI